MIRDVVQVEEYLSELQIELRELPYGQASELIEGIAEELRSLDQAEVGVRIAKLGSPSQIAAELRREMLEGQPVAQTSAALVLQSKPEGMRSTAFVVTASLVVAFGGVIVPVLGWAAGVVLMWMSPVWGRGQKWMTTLLPIVAFAVPLLVVGALAAAQGAPAGVTGDWGPPTVTDFFPEGARNPLLPAAYDVMWSGIALGLLLGAAAMIVSGAALLVRGLRQRDA